MKALTIRQPWAWAIIHAGKDVENRPRRSHYRGWVAVHAGKGMTKGEWSDACAFIHSQVNSLIVIPDYGSPDFVRGAIIGIMKIVDCVADRESPWFVGQYGLVIGAVRALNPIPCGGQLGLWNTTFEVTNEIRRQLGLTTR